MKTYFVLSDGENPIQILFSEPFAKTLGEKVNNAYIDIFDQDGFHVEVIKHVYDDNDVSVWTSDF